MRKFILGNLVLITAGEHAGCRGFFEGYGRDPSIGYVSFFGTGLPAVRVDVASLRMG